MWKFSVFCEAKGSAFGEKRLCVRGEEALCSKEGAMCSEEGGSAFMERAIYSRRVNGRAAVQAKKVMLYGSIVIKYVV